jgi:anti-sigma regulatory factor (Ser/Thr protein kinase)
MKKFTLLADKNIQASFKVVLDKELIGQNKEFLFKVHIAASEALQNIVRHIYHFEKNKEVRIWFEMNKNEMTLFIEDDGPPIRDLSFLSLERAPNEKGNMGLNLIKKLTKSFNIEASQKGNLTILQFEIF